MVLHCIDYNAKMIREGKDWTMLFLNQRDRSYRMYGYVAFNSRRAEWRRTKKEAIAANVYDPELT